MSTTNQLADTYRINHGTPAAEKPIAVLARAIVDANGNTVIDGDNLAALGAATVALTGAISVNDTTTPSVSLATGKTNTGFFEVFGKTSGALKITVADASAQVVTQTLAAQTSGAATLTIPDLGGVSQSYLLSGTPALLKQLTEVVTATNVIAASESGSVFFLNSATEFVSTLPAPAAGLNFTFICTAAPSGASYTIVTNGSANIIKGLQNSVAGDAGDFGTTDDTISFVDGQAVAGDKVTVFCDGTNWFAYAISKVAAGITFTTAS